jgi:hypothetical protein
MNVVHQVGIFADDIALLATDNVDEVTVYEGNTAWFAHFNGHDQS